MTEPTQLPFVLNQAQIDAAIAKELLKPSRTGLKIDYTSGRPPRGLTGAITVSEELIRRAVIAHARMLVNPMFTHFSVDFVATRGDDGITANIIASDAELTPEEPAATPVARPRAAIAAQAVAAAAQVAEEAEAVQAPVEETDDAPTDTDKVEDTVETAPWEGEEDSQPVEDINTTTTGAEEGEAPAPAPRARLFANLTRPSNEPAE